MRNLLCAILILTFTTAAVAKDFRVSEVQSLDGVIKCNSFRNGWLTSSTGPCDRFQPPAAIALGQQFFESGKAHTIKIIVASQVEKDYKDDNLTIKAGQWYCIAAESSKDLDMDGHDNRDWLFIPKCLPTR